MQYSFIIVARDLVHFINIVIKIAYSSANMLLLHGNCSLYPEGAHNPMGQYDADAKYDKIMATGVLAAGATGPLIIAAPLVDITAMVAVWTRMATEIAALNHVDLDKKTTAKTITAVIAGAGAYVGSAKLVMTVVAKVPGIGMIAGSGVNAVANIAMTLWFGFAMIDLYSRDKKVDDLEDLVTFLVEEINPKKNAKKLGRITAFARRAAKLLRKPKD